MRKISDWLDEFFIVYLVTSVYKEYKILFEIGLVLVTVCLVIAYV